MIGPDDLLGIASDVLARPKADVTEAMLRRAVSTAYYGLFHLLTGAGARLFAHGGTALQSQAARAYNHATMRKVCEAYRRIDTTAIPSLVDQVVFAKPDTRLQTIATTFVEAQTGRHEADYNPSSVFRWSYASELIDLILKAREDFAAIQHQPETTTFLTALLLADRWTRRG